MAGITDQVDRSDMRWTVDTQEDLAFVREVYRSLGTEDFTWRDVLKVLDARPELLADALHTYLGADGVKTLLTLLTKRADAGATAS